MVEALSKTEHFVLHGAALAAAGVGAGLARLPGADAAVLVTIQSTMVIALGDLYGVPMSRAAAADLILTLTATMSGRMLSHGLQRLVPGLGEAFNAATAAALTECVGLAAIRWFRSDPRRSPRC